VNYISLKAVLITVGIILLISCVYISVVNDVSPTLLLLAFWTNLLNILFTHVAFQTNNKLLKLYVFVFLFWYLFRLPVLLYDTGYHSFIDWPNWVLSIFTEEDFVYSLSVLALYHIVTGFVILTMGSIGPMVSKSNNLETSEKPWPDATRLFNLLFKWFVVLALYHLTHNILFQLGRGTLGGIEGYVNLIFAKDLVVHLLWFIGLSSYKSFQKKTKQKFWVFLLLYAFADLSGGSRGGVIGLMFVAAIYYLVRYKNFAIRISTGTIGLGCGIFLFSVVTLYSGHIYRAVYRNPEIQLSTNEIVQAAKNHPWLVSDWLDWISVRMSRFDNFSMAVIQEEHRFEHMIGFVNAFKVLGNWVVPGDVFTYKLYRLVPGTRAVALDYSGVDYASIDPTHTDVIGLFGSGVAYFGAYGGLALVLGSLLLWFVVVTLATPLVPQRFRMLWWLVVYWRFYSVLQVSGLDWLIFSHVLLSIQLVMIIAFNKMLSVMQIVGDNSHAWVSRSP